MRRITYTILAPVGSGTAKKKGSLVDLVLAIPYLICGPINGGFIPPLQVLNDVLNTGDSGAGMSGGCKWKPLQIDEEEYKDLVKRLRRIEGKNYKLLFPPAWVESHSDWTIWMTELFLGVPSKKHRALSQKCKRIEQAILRAKASGNKMLLMSLRIKHSKAHDDLSSFINEYFLWKQGYGF